MNKAILTFLGTLLLSGCSTGIPLSKYAPQNQQKEDFTFCYGYSCTYKAKTEFTDGEWKTVKKIFAAKSKTPAEERSKIGRAIAKMEMIIGKKTNTSHDEAEAKGIKKDPRQMDCLDETVNTSRYLGFLYTDGLLQFHELSEPVHRGYILVGGWPHNTATIQEIKTKKKFVVDSFYRANGEEPYILPSEKWLAGWRPPGAMQ